LIQRAPLGLQTVVHWLPLTEAAVLWAGRGYVVFAAMALVGAYTRAALLVLLVCASYLFSVRQLTGSVLHNMHLLWFLAILCASKGAASLSVDAWFTRSETPKATPAEQDDEARACLRLLRVLLGLVYFFPGYWKLQESGLSWALSDNLQNQMYAKWLQFGHVPSLRLDSYPWALKALGLGTLAFELSFIALAQCGPRVRRGLAVAGVLFHLGIESQMLIPFASLWGCYLLLGPWSTQSSSASPKAKVPLPKRLFDAAQSAAKAAPLATAIGSICIAMLVDRGLRGQSQAFPFACYPTFQWRQGDTLPDICVADEGQAPSPVLAQRSQQLWGETWSVLGLGQGAYNEPSLREFVNRHRGAARGPRTLYRCDVYTAPGKESAPPKRLDRLVVETTAKPKSP
jgi:Vitamin K-dependent gamma-carboxylase